MIKKIRKILFVLLAIQAQQMYAASCGLCHKEFADSDVCINFAQVHESCRLEANSVSFVIGAVIGGSIVGSVWLTRYLYKKYRGTETKQSDEEVSEAVVGNESSD